MKDLSNVDRKAFLNELIDVFIDSNFFGYKCNGGSHYPQKNVLILDLSKEVNGEFKDIAIKLDLSKIGIEFGTHEYPEDESDGIFTPVLKIE